MLRESTVGVSSHRLVTRLADCLSSFQHGTNLFLFTASITTFSAATDLPFPLAPPLLPPFFPVSTAVAGHILAASSALLVSFRRNGWGKEALVSSTMGDGELAG